jgi:hypothetical protein
MRDTTRRPPCEAVRVSNSDDPRKWVLDLPPDRVELYVELINDPRPLTSDEAVKMVELVDAWRALERRKHEALMRALA